MELNRIYAMQQKLDKHINKEHGLERVHLIPKKTLSLLVELGELANETRCFKFWSKKPPSEREIILEEFVDGIHFILSLLIEREVPITRIGNISLSYTPNRDLTDDFLELYMLIIEFYNASLGEVHKSLLIKVLYKYISFGIKMGFNWNEIEQAYIRKNEINHTRQDSGY